VKNVTFRFETSPNTNPTRKRGGTWHIMSPSLKNWWDTSPVFPTKLRRGPPVHIHCQRSLVVQAMGVERIFSKIDIS